MNTGAPQPTPDTRILLTAEEHTRADTFALWIRCDKDAHDSEQLTLDYVPFAGIIGGRKECSGAALTAPSVTAPIRAEHV